MCYSLVAIFFSAPAPMIVSGPASSEGRAVATPGLGLLCPPKSSNSRPSPKAIKEKISKAKENKYKHMYSLFIVYIMPFRLKAAV
jgi:hypothetical protein